LCGFSRAFHEDDVAGEWGHSTYTRAYLEEKLAGFPTEVEPVFFISYRWLAESVANDELVAVIGYPARDSRIPVRPHGRVTERRRHRVARAIAESNRAVSDVAREYQVSWPTAHKALVSAAATWPPEPEPTTRLGIDETRFRSVRWILDGITWKRSNPWLTAFVDCSRDGPGSLLGLAPGRTGAGVREWLASSPKRSASGSRSW
jgi:hypothetical protein